MEFWKRLTARQHAFLVTGVILIFLASGIVLYPRFSTTRPDRAQDEIVLANEPPLVTVYVTGAVTKTGIYSLPRGSRVADLLKKAGTGKDWDPEGINLAKRLEDEDMVVVPKISAKRSSEPSRAITPDAARHFPKRKLGPKETISVNKATLQDLEALPGVGPGMAKKILDYRLANGSFSSIEELQDIPGLGGKKFERIKPYLRL